MMKDNKDLKFWALDNGKNDFLKKIPPKIPSLYAFLKYGTVL